MLVHETLISGFVGAAPACRAFKRNVIEVIRKSSSAEKTKLTFSVSLICSAVASMEKCVGPSLRSAALICWPW